MLKFHDGPLELREDLTQNGQTLDLTRVMNALRRRRWTILGAVGVWCLLGLFYVLTTPRYYDASVQVMLDANIGRTLSQVTSTTDLTITDSTMESARLVIASDQIAGRVVDELDLQTNAAFMNPPISMTAQILGTIIGYARLPMVWLRAQSEQVTNLDLTGATAQAPMDISPELIAAQERALAIQALQSEIWVYRIGQSSAFAITYRSTDPHLAAAVVNAFAEVYVSDVLNANFEATERMTTWMQDRLNMLESDARAAARAAEAFRAENGLVNTNNTSMSQNAVSALNTDLTDAIANTARARARVSALEQVVDRGLGSLVSDGVPAGLPPIGDPEFQQIQNELTNLVTNLKRVRRVPDASPATIRSWEVRVQNAAERLFSAIKIQMEQARGEASLFEARANALRESLNDAVSNDVEAGRMQVDLRALEDRAATLTALYQNFLTKFQEIEQQKSFPVSNVRVLNAAQIPQFAAGPSAKTALALCIILGLITGLCLAAIREWRDRFLYSAEQATDEIGVRFLGYLPELPAAAVAQRSRMRAVIQDELTPSPDQTDGCVEVLDTPPSYALKYPRSPFSETLRSIRLSSQIVGRGSKSVVLGICSSRPNEGKTLTAYNLATSIAAGGYSVMLIDADPHRSGLSRLFGPRRRTGLLEVLTGQMDWMQARKQVGETGVDLIPGQMPKEFLHPQELLSSSAFGQLIYDLREFYDFIIVDLAPMGAVSDVRAMIDDIDYVVMIAEWGKTRKLLLNKLIHSDPRVAEKVLGVVLNRVNLRRLRAYSDEGDSAAYSEDYREYYSG